MENDVKAYIYSQAFDEGYEKGYQDGRQEATVDVAPVIHGHWIYQGLSRPYNCFSRCSCCGVVFDGYETFEYCPKCGADMRGEQDE